MNPAYKIMYTWFPAWRTNHFNAETVMKRYRSGPLNPEQQTLITMLAHSLGWPVEDVARALLICAPPWKVTRPAPAAHADPLAASPRSRHVSKRVH